MAQEDAARFQSNPMGRWPAGMNNVDHLRALQEQGAVRRALNVDWDKVGHPRRRAGYESIQSANFHSGYAPEGWPFAVLVKDGMFSIMRLVDGVETLTPQLAVNDMLPFSYAVQNDELYCTNSQVAFKVDQTGAVKAWGVQHPGGQPTLAAAADGGLDAGRYQVAVTFLNAAGEESGCEQASLVVVGANGGINLTQIPQPSSVLVTAIRIYVSPPNGDILYYAAQVPVGTTAFTITRGEVGDPGRQLETMLHDRVVPAAFVFAYKGRLYFAVGDTLYYTPAFRYGLYKRHHGYIRFPHPLKAGSPVDDGFFIGTQYATYFLGGDDPKQMRQRAVDGFGIVPRSNTQIRRSAFKLESTSEGFSYVWWNTNGNLVRADNGGLVQHLTRGRLALPEFAEGAILHREQDKISQIISILKGPQQARSNFGARDTASAEIYRNGVRID